MALATYALLKESEAYITLGGLQYLLVAHARASVATASSLYGIGSSGLEEACDAVSGGVTGGDGGAVTHLGSNAVFTRWLGPLTGPGLGDTAAPTDDAPAMSGH